MELPTTTVEQFSFECELRSFDVWRYPLTIDRGALRLGDGDSSLCTNGAPSPMQSASQDVCYFVLDQNDDTPDAVFIDLRLTVSAGLN